MNTELSQGRVLGRSMSYHAFRGRLQSRQRVVTTWAVIPGKIPTLPDSELFHGNSTRAADIVRIAPMRLSRDTERERDQEAGKWGEGFGDGVAEATFSLAIQAPIQRRSPKPPRPFPPLPCPSGTLHPLTTHPSSPPGSFPSCTCLSHPIIVGSVEVALETSRRVTDASIRSFLDQSR